MQKNELKDSKYDGVPTLLDEFSHREREVFWEMLEFKTAQQIADDLNITKNASKVFINKIYKKTAHIMGPSRRNDTMGKRMQFIRTFCTIRLKEGILEYEGGE